MASFNKKPYEPLYENEPEKTIKKTQAAIKTFWWVSILVGLFISAQLYTELVSHDPVIYDSLNDFSTTYLITLNPPDKNEVSSGSAVQKPELQLADNVKSAVFSQEKSLVFQMKSKWLLFYKFSKYFFFWGICFLVIHQLKRFAVTIATDGVFSAALVKTSRNIGTIFIVSGFFLWAFNTSKIEFDFVSSFMKNLIILKNGRCIASTQNYYQFNVIFVIIFILFGNLFYTFSFLFKRGLALQKENDLTV